MSLSKAEKEYWTNELLSELNLQIDRIALECDVDPREQARRVAEDTLVEEYGIGQMMLDAEHYSEQSDKYYQLYQQNRDLANEAGNEIEKVLKQHAHAERVNITGRYYSRTWRDKLAGRVEADVPLLLATGDYGEAGLEIAKLMNASDNLERTIMFATSPTQLKNFLRAFAAKHDVYIGDVFDLE